MVSLKWNRVAAWRLSRHHLLEPVKLRQWLDVVSRIGGAHAQLMSAAELSLAARVRGITPDHIQDALWERKTLVKTWNKRGTLHLVAAVDFPVHVAALSTYRHFRRASWLKHHGVTAEELESVIEGVRDTLQASGLTREQLAAALVEHTGEPRLGELLKSGWGALLKPAAVQGYLCYGPDEGRNVTFVAPGKWLGELLAMEPDDAWKTILRDYLSAYGPAAIEDFGRWWGLEPSRSKKVFRGLGDEIEEVDVEGWKAWALTVDLEPMRTLEAPDTVRLLPAFDPYVNSTYRHCQHLLPDGTQGRVFRPQGWVSPVVLVNGRMEGVWQHDKKPSRHVVTVDMFSSASEQTRRGIEAEAQRIGDFLEVQVELKFA